MAERAPGQRERRRTWSSLGNLSRKPNDYEIVTHNMNHTIGNKPLDMGPDVHGNVWLKKYRNDIPLKVSDWNKFRDPDRVTYDSYVKMQDEQETYVDNLLISYTKDKSIDERLSSDCLKLLADAFTPCRYLVHAQQMISAYIFQLAPSSYVGNCAAFQVADQLRRVQRIAYRTKQLDNAHPAHSFGSRERGVWENEPHWQPIRKVMERLLVVFEWDQALVANNLVVRPICDDLFLNQLATAARTVGDELDALILENLYHDSSRHNRWTVALAKLVIEENSANRGELRRIANKWETASEEIIRASSELISGCVPGLSAEAIAQDVRRNSAQLHSQAGLGGDA
jgi:hypothetical protein